jgi:transposase
VDVRATATVVELLHNGRSVALHRRVYGRGNHYETRLDHRPKAHQVNHDWPPERLIAWAAKVGPGTAKVIAKVMADRPHPEQGYRSALGIMRLAKIYGDTRLELASLRALTLDSCRYQSIKMCLRNGMDGQPLLPPAPPAAKPLTHANIRGAEYYKMHD